MANGTLIKRFCLVVGICVLLFGYHIFPADTQAKKVRIKKGAETITVKGVTRSWKAADKTPLDKRKRPRRMKSVLNFERNRPIVKTAGDADPVVQRSFTGRKGRIGRDSSMPSPDSTFEGMSKASNGSGWPPDTCGDVGETYYIQAINSSIAI
ncbi:MAG: hypothetical protein GY765_18420, partial [bacterium]|nr:hypothetical protein [bacterium]